MVDWLNEHKSASIVGVCVIALCIVSSAFAINGVRNSRPEQPPSGKVEVKLKPSVIKGSPKETESFIRALLEPLGAEVRVEEIKSNVTDAFKIQLTANISAAKRNSVIQKLQADPTIASVTIDPNDPSSLIIKTKTQTTPTSLQTALQQSLPTETFQEIVTVIPLPSTGNSSGSQSASGTGGSGTTSGTIATGDSAGTQTGTSTGSQSSSSTTGSSSSSSGSSSSTQTGSTSGTASSGSSGATGQTGSSGASPSVSPSPGTTGSSGTNSSGSSPASSPALEQPSIVVIITVPPGQEEEIAELIESQFPQYVGSSQPIIIYKGAPLY